MACGETRPVYKGPAPSAAAVAAAAAAAPADMQLLVALLVAALGCAHGRPEAPYPPSGWRPEGRQFSLPSRSSGLYAPPPPPQQYGPPPQQYGPPPTTTEAAETTTTELPTTTAPNDAGAGADGARALAQSGVYYLLQPDGRLQRVAYAHGPAPAAPAAPAALAQAQGAAPVDAGYLARFHYQDLPPAGAPIYAYGAPKLVRLS